MNAISGAGGQMYRPTAKEMFQRMDADSDGKITKDEFTSAKPPGGGPRGTKGPDPSELFDKIDANGDGAIDEEENESFLKEMEERRGKGPNLSKIFEKIDTNGDGAIDEDENESFLKALEAKMKQAGESSFSYDARGNGKSQASSTIFDVLI
jgi:Ca2+-binding EF-hand superfamily protein